MRLIEAKSSIVSLMTEKFDFYTVWGIKQGINFPHPVDYLLMVLDQMVEDGVLLKGKLGYTLPIGAEQKLSKTINPNQRLRKFYLTDSENDELSMKLRAIRNRK